MTCDEAKNMITISVFGTPDPDEAAALRDHLDRCPSCARIYRSSSVGRNPVEIPDDPRMPDWERSWEVISSRSLDRRKTFRIFRIPGSWAVADATLSVVFVLGFFAGRRFLRPTPGPVSAKASLPAKASPLQVYADSVEPILTDFLNRGATAPPPEMAELRKRILRSMLEETRLLKAMADPSRDAALSDFLDELENVLVSLSNLKSGDLESADLLDRAIRDRQMRSKLRELSGVNITI